MDRMIMRRANANSDDLLLVPVVGLSLARLGRDLILRSAVRNLIRLASGAASAGFSLGARLFCPLLFILPQVAIY